jgi:4-aminobutyrate aminotransferase-like enzyme
MTGSQPPRRPSLLDAYHTDQAEYSPETANLELIQSRQKHLGASILFYHNPIHLVRGRGVYLYDSQNREYLDCYNNVASVGHCHPHVVKALCDQAQELNTHTRYLHENVIQYAEMLADTMPGNLDICMFVCTGSEANELAMRIARSVTGNNGAIVMENSYHGNSTLISELSTITYSPNSRPDHVVAVEPPNTYRGPYLSGENNLGERYASLVDEAIGVLDDKGQRVAAFLCDTIFDTQGTLEAPADYFEKVYAKIRAAGGLCIADEVQAGLSRTGKYWGFEHYNVVPDIVTLGKPMGDGHPVAAVVTTPEIAESFSNASFYFNTFGGNPVSAAVGKAVLEVIRDEAITDHVEETGAYLRKQLEALAERHAIIGDVRGKGLFLGIELVADRVSREPANEVARDLPDRLRDEGILVGLSGRLGNVLKIRPPLVFSRDNADFLVRTLDRTLP